MKPCPSKTPKPTSATTQPKKAPINTKHRVKRLRQQLERNLDPYRTKRCENDVILGLESKVQQKFSRLGSFCLSQEVGEQKINRQKPEWDQRNKEAWGKKHGILGSKSDIYIFLLFRSGGGCIHVPHPHPHTLFPPPSLFPYHPLPPPSPHTHEKFFEIYLGQVSEHWNPRWEKAQSR